MAGFDVPRSCVSRQAHQNEEIEELAVHLGRRSLDFGRQKRAKILQNGGCLLSVKGREYLLKNPDRAGADERAELTTRREGIFLK